MPSLRYLRILVKQEVRRAGAPPNVGTDHRRTQGGLVMWAGSGRAVNTGGWDARGNDAKPLFLCS